MPLMVLALRLAVFADAFKFHERLCRVGNPRDQKKQTPDRRLDKLLPR